MRSNNWPPLRDRRGVSLPDAVKAEFGKGCPCCGRRNLIWRWSAKPGKRTPNMLATHAHDHAVARGGDPRQWFFSCSQCNNEQGALDLVTWARKLVYGQGRVCSQTAQRAECPGEREQDQRGKTGD